MGEPVEEVTNVLSSLTGVTNSAVQPCDLLHRSSKVLQFDFSGEGKNKTSLSNYGNMRAPLLCSSLIHLYITTVALITFTPRLSPRMNARNVGEAWEGGCYDRTTAYC